MDDQPALTMAPGVTAGADHETPAAGAATDDAATDPGGPGARTPDAPATDAGGQDSTAADEGLEQGSEDASTAASRRRRPRPETIGLAVLLGSAFVFLVAISRYRWFYGDEWSFLASPPGSGLAPYFQAHNGHWTTIPYAVYRVLWHTVGLRSYLPYILTSISVHLVVVVLLWRVMRRAGVSALVGLASCVVLLLFGPGQAGIVQAFQIAFSGSLAFGLAHLLFADHDGPVDRRDALGLAAGALGILCSGVALTMVPVVGLAVLLRRGWRTALLHTVPLAVLYGTWFAIEKPKNSETAGMGQIPGFVLSGLAATFRGLGHVGVVGAALAVMLVVGLVVAWAPLPWARWRTEAAAPAALLAGAVAFFTIAGFGRAVAGDEYAGQSRYLYVVAALLLPALAVAADAIATRWPRTLPAVLVLLLVGVPWNAADFAPTSAVNSGKYNEAYFDQMERVVADLANSPDLRRVPLDGHPLAASISTFNVDVGWLIDASDGDRIPMSPPGKPDPATARLLLGVDRVGGRPLTGCNTYTEPFDIEPARGDRFGIDGPVAITSMQGSKALTKPVQFAPRVYGPFLLQYLAIQLDDLQLRVGPTKGATSFTWCS